ncbi:DNA adenine methylase [Micromonospora sp. CPCC 206061]|uniref:DNA adenine methylase n=1 Tax=Micromonospora sp. CPCC 206061 TaxID=3122410 RepID=UPI002FF33954
MRYQSPLRYPGAKSGLSGVIGELITAARSSIGPPELFLEPFAGGSATSLRLAGAGLANRVLIADADPLVARFWQVAAADTEWLIDRMWEEPVTLERWDFWRSWKPSSASDRDIAMKCLFLNRTTFSGILHGRAGPIGGRRQDGPYSIDCRFNKEGIERRLRFVGDLYATNRIADVWCKDWQHSLVDVAEWYPQLLPNKVVTYLDPPYLERSMRLYGKSFDPSGGYAPKGGISINWSGKAEHYRLAEYLRRRAQFRWILSYDNHPVLIGDEGLYAANQMGPTAEERSLLGVRSWKISKRLVNLRYSVTSKIRSERSELLITTLPPGTVPSDGKFMAIP